MAERGNRRALSPRDLVDGVTRFDPSAGLELEECVERFAPILIVNQAKTPADRELGWEIRSSARNFLGARVEFLGALDWDESVKQAVRQRRPVRQLYPTCPFSRDLRAVTDRLLHPDMPSPPRAGRGSVVSIARTRADGAPLPPLDLSEPGAYLRRAREHLGLTLSQLRKYTRIRCLELIECQRFALLPPEPYARGFILLYARTLGIREAEDLATSYMDHYRRDRKALLL